MIFAQDVVKGCGMGYVYMHVYHFAEKKSIYLIKISQLGDVRPLACPEVLQRWCAMGTNPSGIDGIISDVANTNSLQEK